MPGRISLVVQWVRIRLPKQGTRAQPLVCEDPHAAEELVHALPLLKPGACALRPEKPAQ